MTVELAPIASMRRCPISLTPVVVIITLLASFLVPERCCADTYSVTVPATAGRDNPVQLIPSPFARRSFVQVVVSGAVQLQPGDPWTGPGGSGVHQEPNTSYVLRPHGYTHGIVVMKVAETEIPMDGGDRALILPHDGILSFYVNDESNSDNAGAFEITVTSYAPAWTDQDEDDIPDAVEDDLIEQFAPVLKFDRDENVKPCDPYWYIRNSDLISFHYSAAGLPPAWTHYDPVYYQYRCTVPFRNMVPFRPEWVLNPYRTTDTSLVFDILYYTGALDHPNQDPPGTRIHGSCSIDPCEDCTAHNRYGPRWQEIGDRRNVGLYAHVVPYNDTEHGSVYIIQYWQFFGFNSADVYFDIGDHEGDWEPIEVWVKNNSIVKVIWPPHGLDDSDACVKCTDGAGCIDCVIESVACTGNVPPEWCCESYGFSGLGNTACPMWTTSGGWERLRGIHDSYSPLGGTFVWEPLGSLPAMPRQHPIVYVEAGTHGLWPAYNSFEGAGKNQGNSPEYGPVVVGGSTIDHTFNIPNLGEMDRPRLGYEAILDFHGLWGNDEGAFMDMDSNPPGPAQHKQLCLAPAGGCDEWGPAPRWRMPPNRPYCNAYRPITYIGLWDNSGGWHLEGSLSNPYKSWHRALSAGSTEDTCLIFPGNYDERIAGPLQIDMPLKVIFPYAGDTIYAGDLTLSSVEGLSFTAPSGVHLTVNGDISVAEPASFAVDDNRFTMNGLYCGRLATAAARLDLDGDMTLDGSVAGNVGVPSTGTFHVRSSATIDGSLHFDGQVELPPGSSLYLTHGGDGKAASLSNRGFLHADDDLSLDFMPQMPCDVGLVDMAAGAELIVTGDGEWQGIWQGHAARIAGAIRDELAGGLDRIGATITIDAGSTLTYRDPGNLVGTYDIRGTLAVEDSVTLSGSVALTGTLAAINPDVEVCANGPLLANGTIDSSIDFGNTTQTTVTGMCRLLRLATIGAAGDIDFSSGILTIADLFQSAGDFNNDNVIVLDNSVIEANLGQGSVINGSGKTIRGYGAIQATLKGSGGTLVAEGGRLTFPQGVEATSSVGTARVEAGAVLDVASWWDCTGSTILNGGELAGGSLYNMGSLSVSGQSLISGDIILAGSSNSLAAGSTLCLAGDAVQQGVSITGSGTWEIAAGGSHFGHGSFASGLAIDDGGRLLLTHGKTLTLSSGGASNCGQILLSGSTLTGGTVRMGVTGSIRGYGTLQTPLVFDADVCPAAAVHTDLRALIAPMGAELVADEPNQVLEVIAPVAGLTALRAEQGTLRIGAATVEDVPRVQILPAGGLECVGLLAVRSVDNQGVLRITQGQMLHVVGSFNQASTARLEVELGPQGAGQVLCDQPVLLAGQMKVRLTEGHRPALGQQFSLLAAPSIQGQFDQLTGLSVGEGLKLAVHYGPFAVSLEVVAEGLPFGDCNGDGHVDMADMTFLAGSWGRHTGDTEFDSRCDLNNDGSVNVIDLLLLARNWGM